jgi:hypothetical protein
MNERMYWETDDNDKWATNKWNEWIQGNFKKVPNLQQISDKLDLIMNHLGIKGEDE